MKKNTLADLQKVMQTLRGPNGCPWDKQQTAESLTPYAVEEALELEDAILHKSTSDVVEELGDVLFQVVFQAQIASEKNQFTMEDIIDSLTRKMILRHPHVFAQTKKSKSLSAAQIKNKWEKDKNQKKTSTSIFDIPRNFPALLSAYKVGKKSRSIQFDWDKVDAIFAHFLTEVEELRQAIKNKDKLNQIEEIGDTLFTLAQVARHLSVDPEKALRLANKKIVDRILECHKLSKLSWPKFSKLSTEKKEVLWEKVKKLKKPKRP